MKCRDDSYLIGNTFARSKAGTMILAIDPGSSKSAWVMWDGAKILGKGIIANDCVDELPLANTVACEHIQCMGMAVGKSVFETAYFIGELRARVKDFGTPFIPVYRSEVKMHFCNSMRAKDGNIRQALIDRLGAPGVKKSPGVTYGVSGDMWSALAIAVMTHDKLKERPCSDQ